MTAIAPSPQRQGTPVRAFDRVRDALTNPKYGPVIVTAVLLVGMFVVGAFRADVARAGAVAEITRLVEELSSLSPEFEALWRDNEVIAQGEGIKRMRHPEAGLLELEFSAFSVDGRPDLGMVVYNPVTAADGDRIRSLIRSRAGEKAVV